MSWLLFMDESGHDHRHMPYEVRGGIAIHARQLWSFVRKWQYLESVVFGANLAQYQKELKGAKLLDRDRFRWASQNAPISDESRRKHCRIFLTEGLEKQSPSREEFTAYGQACLKMANEVFQLLHDHEAVLFAAAIPQNNFQKTQTGRERRDWIVPTPFFVASEMTIPLQAADLCIYCVNWGFRLPNVGMNAETRSEIEEFAPWLRRLQFIGRGYRESQRLDTFGIVHVPDPYEGRIP